MPHVSSARLRAEVESVYAEPLRRKATRTKILQALSEFERAGLTSTSAIKPALIAAWIAQHPGRRPTTVYALLRSFRSICSLAMSCDWLKRDPFQFRGPAKWVELPGPGADDQAEPRDRHRSAEQIGRLLALLDREEKRGGWREARLRALVYTLAYLGLRKLEALQLHRDDVDLSGPWVKIRSRGRRRLKTRASNATMAVPPALAKVLAPWLAKVGSEWVFPGVTRRAPWTGGPVGGKALDEVKAAGKRAGLDNLTMLDFRHTIATLAEGWGMGELELMRLMRHSRPTTQTAYRKHGDAAASVATSLKIRFPSARRA